MKTRDNWRRFEGNFVGHVAKVGLTTPGGRSIQGNTGRELNEFDKLLKGPCSWRSQLTEKELAKHDEWVDAVGHVQSLFDDEYVPPIHVDDLHPVWFDVHSCPDTQVYVNKVPEMNEKQLNGLLLTWAGMLPHGNPTVVSVKHL
eukprot:8069333-Pyramimonas_sp.AAC.1